MIGVTGLVKTSPHLVHELNTNEPSDQKPDSSGLRPLPGHWSIQLFNQNLTSSRRSLIIVLTRNPSKLQFIQLIGSDTELGQEIMNRLLTKRH